MALVTHPDRGFAHLPGISPYSGGVSALDGFVVRRHVVRDRLGWQDGFRLIDRVLADAGRPPVALCSIELRCPEPHSFGGFGSFNDEYRDALAERGILLEDGANPVARTNVAPVIAPPASTELFAFGFTVVDDRASEQPSFIVSGAGDLYDQADLRPEAIVGGTASWADSGAERADVVLGEMEARLAGLGVTWSDTDDVVTYSAEPIDEVVADVVLARLGAAARRGVHRYLARPPIAGLLFEMDCRGGVDSRTIG